MRKQLLFTALVIVLLASSATAQDNLDSVMNTMSKTEKETVGPAFKAHRVINLQTPEKTGAGNLQFLIQHRFGPINGGGYEFFGLDQSTIRIGLEYGINKWIAVGIGRSSFEKTYDGSVKVSLLNQSKGAHASPVSLAYFGSVAINGLKWTDTSTRFKPAYRFSYTSQLIIASKISDRFSFEVVPTYIRKNLVETVRDNNNFFAVGTGARFKLTRRTSINAEYIFRIPPTDQTAPSYANFYNSFSLGFDIETGGHVFQLHLTNSLPMIERGFITETSEKWNDAGIHLGFNISRDFSFGKKAKKW